jgi:DNA polymerase-4
VSACSPPYPRRQCSDFWAAGTAAWPPTGPAASTRAPSSHALPAFVTVSRAFLRHTLDGTQVRAALLDLVVQLGHLLRRRGQAARALMLTLRFAGGPSWDKTRRLPEASAHEEGLRVMAYRLIDAAGLQRGRLTGLVLKAEDLADADQISLDRPREARLVAEEVSDRIRDKFAPGIIGPAAAFRHAS